MVCFHCELPLEAYTTLWAGEGSLTRVHAPVADQQRWIGKPASTVHTHMTSLAGLNIGVWYLDRKLHTCYLVWGSFGRWLCPCRGLGSHGISLMFNHLFRLQLSRSLCRSLSSFLAAPLCLIWNVSSRSSSQAFPLLRILGGGAPSLTPLFHPRDEGWFGAREPWTGFAMLLPEWRLPRKP